MQLYILFLCSLLLLLHIVTIAQRNSDDVRPLSSWRGALLLVVTGCCLLVFPVQDLFICLLFLIAGSLCFWLGSVFFSQRLSRGRTDIAHEGIVNLPLFWTSKASSWTSGVVDFGMSDDFH